MGHIDHCLGKSSSPGSFETPQRLTLQDAIRSELMCRAEVTFTTYSWLPDLQIPWATLSYPHTCVDYDVR